MCRPAAVSLAVFAAPSSLDAGEDVAGWEEEPEAPESVSDSDEGYESSYEEPPPEEPPYPEPSPEEP
jgi:hypothetical protein